MAKSVMAGEAYVRLTADSAGLESGVKKSRKALEELGKTARRLDGKGIGTAITRGIRAMRGAVRDTAASFGSIAHRIDAVGNRFASLGARALAAGSVGAAGIAYVTRNFVVLGDALDKMSARLGASVEWLSAMGYAAERSGAELESIADVVKETNVAISEAMTEAKAGSGTKYEAFKALKLDPSAVAFDGNGNARSVERQFEVIADALSKVDNQMDKTRIAMDLWGDEGVKLLPMIGSIRALKTEAKSFGIVMTGHQARTAAALLDAWTNVKYQLTAIWVSLGEAFAPALRQIADWMSRIVIPIQKFVKENKQLFVLMAKGVAAFAALGAALIAVKVILFPLSTAFSMVGGALTGVLAVGGGVMGLCKGLVAPLALLSSALVHVGGGIAGVVGGIVKLGLIRTAIPVIAKTAVVLLMLLNPLNLVKSALFLVGSASTAAIGSLTGFMAASTSLGKGLVGVFSLPTKLAAGMLHPLNALRLMLQGTIGQSFMMVAASVKASLASVKASFLAMSTLGKLAFGGWTIGIIAGTAALGYWIYQSGIIGRVWQGLKDAIGHAIESIGASWDWVCDGFASKWSETVDMVRDNFGVLKDALMLGNFADAWDLALSMLKYSWLNWTMGLMDVWDAFVANFHVAGAYMATGLMKSWTYAAKFLHTSWIGLKNMFKAGWDYIGWACKTALSSVGYYVADIFDGIATDFRKAMLKVKTYIPGNGYTDEMYTADAMELDDRLAGRRYEREAASARARDRYDAELEDGSRSRQAEMDRVAGRYDAELAAYDTALEQMVDEANAGLDGKMLGRRDELTALEGMIARQREALRKKNDEETQMRLQQTDEEVRPEYGNVLDSIADNTEETARNTSKEATSAYNAAAIGVQWSPMTVLAMMAREARRRALPVPGRERRVALAQSAVRAVGAVTVGQPRELAELPRMDKTLVAMLTQLGALNGNVGRYASGIDGMLRAV